MNASNLTALYSYYCFPGYYYGADFSAAANKWFRPRLDFKRERIPASAAIAGAAFYFITFYISQLFIL